jgi:alpha/beta superfamily hydrolase
VVSPGHRSDSGRKAARDNGGVGEAAISRETVAYWGEQLLDMYVPARPRAVTTVVLWHGSGTNERVVLEPLARQIGRAGVHVVVPDWSSDDGADGRDHLRASLSFVQHLYPDAKPADRVVLAGWSLGASAGLDVVRRPEVVDGWRPTAFVGISGGYNRSPFSPEREQESSGDPAIPLVLVHGSSDEIVPLDRSLVTYDHLAAEGWRVTLREVPTDHAGAIGAVYDPVRQRCLPTDAPARREVLITVATIITDLALAGE